MLKTIYAATLLVGSMLCQDSTLSELKKRTRRQVQNCVGSQCSQRNIDVGDLFGGNFNPFKGFGGPGTGGFGVGGYGNGGGFFGGGFGNNLGGGGQHNLGAGVPKAQPTQNCVGSQCQQSNLLGNSGGVGGAGGLGHHHGGGGSLGGLGHHNVAGAGHPKSQPTQNCVASQCQQDNTLGNLAVGAGLGLDLGLGPLGYSGHDGLGLGNGGFHVRRKRDVRFVQDIMKRK